MKFEDIKGNIKLHIGCKKEYLDGWINVNTVPDDVEVQADATWNLSSLVFWQKSSVDLIYAEDFANDIAIRGNIEGAVDMMLAAYKYILKPKGILIIGLDNPEFAKKFQPWLKQLGFGKVLFFDVQDINDKKYLSVKNES